MADDGTAATNYARIKVIGIGGGGCNALYRLLESMNGDTPSNVVYIPMNTDSQSLNPFSEDKIKKRMTGQVIKLSGDEGLGAGGNPQVGEKIMNEAIAAGKLEEVIDGKEDLVIVTAGMGGGTGSGGAPIFCEYIVEKSPNAVPVFVGTWPYSFEGDVRKANADYCYKKLIAIPQVKILTIENDSLLEMAKTEYAKIQGEQPQEGKRKRKGIPAKVAFGFSDRGLIDGISVITDLITIRTDVNLDMNDAKTIMSAGRTIRFGKILSNENENRAMEAFESMIQNPIYRNSINGGAAYLVAFYGDVEIEEMHEVANKIQSFAKPGVIPIFGGMGGKDLGDKIEIAMIATGFEDTVKVGAEEKAAENRSKQTAADAEATKIEYEDGSFKLDKTDED